MAIGSATSRVTSTTWLGVADQGVRALWSRAVALLALCTLLAACDDMSFPRDPEKTLETVLAEGRMTVAFADSPPWVTVDRNAPPQGVEVDLVQAFAEDLGVAIEWRRLGAFAALEGLERGDIDLAIGGFDRKAVTPVEGAAPSYAYYKETFVIAARADVENPGELEGRPVFVPRELPLAELVRKEGGILVDEWTDEVGLAVVPTWLLDARNAAYEQALDNSATDAQLRPVIEKGLADERRHRQWMETAQR